jgi:hypothetical protein
MKPMPLSVKSAALVLCVALALWLIPVRAAEPIPSRLTDEAFWKMVTGFSEEGGSFRFENFLSNELGFQMVIPQLKEITKPGGVYLGVGPEQNFTYIAALQPKMAFIIDIRRQNMLELMMYRAFFELSPDRAEFLSHLFARKRPAHLEAQSTPEELFASYDGEKADPLLFKKYLDDAKDVLVKQHKFGLSDEDLTNIAYVYRVFMESGPDLDYQVGGFSGGSTPTYMDLMTMNDGQGKNRSFLGTEEAYRTVRDMEMKNLIVPLVGDFAGPKAIRNVAQYLKDHEVKITAFYLSNVEQYLFQDGVARQFYENVGTLPIDSSSQFIRTSTNNGNFRFQYQGFGMRFVTLLSPISDVLNALQDGRIRYYNDVLAISHQ